MNLSRRNFMALSGGLVATSMLPVLAKENDLFRKRGRFERMSLAMRQVRCGAE
jgi:hypothetical protein